MASLLKLSSDGETFQEQDCARFSVQAPFHRWSDQGLAEIGHIEIRQYKELVRIEVAALMKNLQARDAQLREGVGLARKLGKRNLVLHGEGPQSSLFIGRPFEPQDPNERRLRVHSGWTGPGSRDFSLPVGKVPLLRAAAEGWIRRKDLIFIANRLGIENLAALK